MHTGDVFLVIDIGSKKIATAIGQKGSEESQMPTILGHGDQPSSGLKKGQITDIQEASKAVKRAIKTAEDLANQHVSDAIVFYFFFLYQRHF